MTSVDPVRKEIFDAAMKQLLDFMDSQQSYMLGYIRGLLQNISFEVMMAHYAPYKTLPRDARIEELKKKFYLTNLPPEKIKHLQNIDVLFSICFS